MPITIAVLLTVDFDRAIEDYDKTIELKPNYADAYYNRGVVRYKKGDFDRAIEDYDKQYNSIPIMPMPITIAGWLTATKAMLTAPL